MNNKFTTYLLYAIGEIFLVVIGILIAVSIDDWNTESKQRSSLNEYLVTLEEEYQVNKLKLDAVRKINTRNIELAQELLGFLGIADPEISKDDLGYLVMSVINAEVQYRPTSTAIDELETSGKLELLKSISLKKGLVGWSSEMTKIQFQERDEVSHFRMKLIDIAMVTINMRNATYEYKDNYFNISESKLNTSSYAILQSLEFENSLVGFIASSGFLEDRYARLDKQIEEIIQELKKELN